MCIYIKNYRIPGMILNILTTRQSLSIFPAFWEFIDALVHKTLHFLFKSVPLVEEKPLNLTKLSLPTLGNLISF